MKKIVSILILLFSTIINAQQLNCTVKVIADKVGTNNNQVFKTLEKAITDFVNKTDWTGEVYKNNEKINCSMQITVNSYADNQFSATIQVQSSRPIYNSTYASPVFNFNDKDFSFKYIEFENLLFDPVSFSSNLVSVLSFYSFMIIGFDGDTYELNGGRSWFDVAQQVLTTAQQGGYKGWSQADGNQNRFFLVNDIISGTFDPFREAMYNYHREGLDKMADDLKAGKKAVMDAIATLSTIYSSRPNAFLTRVFFDAKSDEIVSILSGGPAMPVASTVDTLNKISTINSSKWANIKL
jgi:hypothetical protein